MSDCQNHSVTNRSKTWQIWAWMVYDQSTQLYESDFLLHKPTTALFYKHTNAIFHKPTNTLIYNSTTALCYTSPQLHFSTSINCTVLKTKTTLFCKPPLALCSASPQLHSSASSQLHCSACLHLHCVLQAHKCNGFCNPITTLWSANPQLHYVLQDHNYNVLQVQNCTALSSNPFLVWPPLHLLYQPAGDWGHSRDHSRELIILQMLLYQGQAGHLYTYNYCFEWPYFLKLWYSSDVLILNHILGGRGHFLK